MLSDSIRSNRSSLLSRASTVSSASSFNPSPPSVDCPSIAISLPQSVYAIGDIIQGVLLVYRSIESLSSIVTLCGTLASSSHSNNFLEKTAIVNLNGYASPRFSTLTQIFTLPIPLQLEGRKRTPASAEFPGVSIVYTIRADFFTPNTRQKLGSVSTVLRIIDEGQFTPLPPIDSMVHNLDVRFEVVQEREEVFRPELVIHIRFDRSSCVIQCRALFDQVCSGEVIFVLKLNCAIQGNRPILYEIVKQAEYINFRPDLRNELSYKFSAVCPYFKIPPSIQPSARTKDFDLYYTLEANLSVNHNGNLTQRVLQPLRITFFNEPVGSNRGSSIDVRQNLETSQGGNSISPVRDHANPMRDGTSPMQDSARLMRDGAPPMRDGASQVRDNASQVGDSFRNDSGKAIVDGPIQVTDFNNGYPVEHIGAQIWNAGYAPPYHTTPVSRPRCTTLTDRPHHTTPVSRPRHTTLTDRPHTLHEYSSCTTPVYKPNSYD
ncbi:hypothetical protein BC937DRAFT_88952 [Endogone sp. FLAS-F59071]|nr:hypothetical protein BC937DRAFT_88952 [Endogone sp. FLAS-F59071]|eukprot:RUS18291.1 hypothetical protein BC937DRAFT_88952 [Endogone sp. FLAS-F59071]